MCLYLPDREESRSTAKILQRNEFPVVGSAGGVVCKLWFDSASVDYVSCVSMVSERGGTRNPSLIDARAESGLASAIAYVLWQFGFQIFCYFKSVIASVKSPFCFFFTALYRNSDL
jgi:hypothetical protein